MRSTLWESHGFFLSFLTLLIQPLYFPLAFCPYHIGHFSVVGLGFEDYVSAEDTCLHFEHCTVPWVWPALMEFLVFGCRSKRHTLTASSPPYWGTSSWLEPLLSAMYPWHNTSIWILNTKSVVDLSLGNVCYTDNLSSYLKYFCYKFLTYPLI